MKYPAHVQMIFIRKCTLLPNWFERLRSASGFSKRPMVNFTLKILATASSILLIGIILFFT